MTNRHCVNGILAAVASANFTSSEGSTAFGCYERPQAKAQHAGSREGTRLYAPLRRGADGPPGEAYLGLKRSISL
jgi:hypothetical protein